jgi:hypothetical protein
MTMMNAKRRTPWQDSAPHAFSDVLLVPAPEPFQASLQSAAGNRAGRHESSRHEVISPSSWEKRHETPRPTIAERSASWLRAQWMLSKAKRSLASERNSSKMSLPGRMIQPKRPSAGVAGQLLSWVQTKYKMSSTKRLKVAEVASLGDKRFVALVSVEGREFLIGGGASGVSLLTPLRGEEDSEISRQRVSATAENRE